LSESSNKSWDLQVLCQQQVGGEVLKMFPGYNRLKKGSIFSNAASLTVSVLKARLKVKLSVQLTGRLNLNRSRILGRLIEMR